MSVLLSSEERDQYVADGWWRDRTLGDIVRDNAASKPDGPAFIGTTTTSTWQQYDDAANSIARELLDAGLQPDQRVAVLLPDSPLIHAVYVGIERAGLIAAGIGPRAGRREIEHLLTKTGASALISPARHREHDFSEVVASLRSSGGAIEHHFSAGGDSGVELVFGAHSLTDANDAGPVRQGNLGPDDLFFLNSTSGTTGMPKVVMHTMNRWYAFHKMAVAAGELTAEDVVMSVIPAPFGFGLWTAHFTPTLLGAPCVVMERFGADEMIAAIERHRVTMLGAVSTQFIMMLGSPALRRHDLSSLRVLFTGGEAVPTDRAARFEAETGASVLQFFGSNETGALSYTSAADTRDQRLRTAGRTIPIMRVRLFGDDGTDITPTGGPGQPGCRGPATCLGYYDDPVANAELVRSDGWMLTGDIVDVDPSGYLSVVGRKTDFIIRGGKNISAPAVEEAVLAVPGVALAAAIPMPSEVYGERVCVYAVFEDGAALDLDAVCAVLDEHGVTKEMWPEELVVVDALPLASGGKVAKAELREDIRRRHERGA